jgi:RNA polymerase sigma-70 factor, ECF subfamily
MTIGAAALNGRTAPGHLRHRALRAELSFANGTLFECLGCMLSPLSTMRALSLRRFRESDDLLTRLQQGDARAVGEIYDQHHEAIRAFAQRLLNDDSVAEDLVHEVFVQLPRIIGQFRGDSSLRTFLTGIAVNHARHYVRSAQRRRAAMQRFSEEPRGAFAEPDSDVERRQLREALSRALDQLPLDQRIAFVLCDIEERTSGEAATLTDAPEATVRTRLFHARKKLRALLEQEGLR